ncbi:fad-dependent oxidoreductase [Cystoisospora suis]|uniref:Fad-dependent oxidoreductase n=1 Tax=Cystoisospora suis TaxID=483139 RepID=A0A2C6KU02_9APIC|nr:fad-dependent oxidoreductase [Cystoisospora suis]
MDSGASLELAPQTHLSAPYTHGNISSCPIPSSVSPRHVMTCETTPSSVPSTSSGFRERSLKFLSLQITSSTDSTCSHTVSTPDSKASDCAGSPRIDSDASLSTQGGTSAEARDRSCPPEQCGSQQKTRGREASLSPPFSAANSPAASAQPSPEQKQVDIAVIGAGLAGLTAALAVHRKTGRIVHVYEKTDGEKSFSGSSGCRPPSPGLERTDERESPGDREILLRTNGLDALRCIDEQLACDVLECGHIVYSDCLDVFEFDLKTTASTLVFGIYWSDFQQILYRHCQQYPEGIIFSFKKELQYTLSTSLPSSSASIPEPLVTLSPETPPSNASTASSSPVPSPYSLPFDHSTGVRLTEDGAGKRPHSGLLSDPSPLVDAALTDKAKRKSEVAQGSYQPGVKLCFYDGQHVDAKLVIGADGPHSCTRTTSAPGSRKSDTYGPAERVQFQGLVEAATHEEESARNLWLFHKETNSQISVIKVLGPNILTWSLTAPASQQSDALKKKDEEAVKNHVLDTITGLVEGATSKNKKVLEMLYRTVERTSVEDIQVVHLNPPAHASWCWTRFDDRMVFVGNAAHPISPNIGQTHDLTIEDTVQLAYCLSDWQHSDALAAQRFSRIRKQSLVHLLKLNEAVQANLWLNGEGDCDEDVHEMETETPSNASLFTRANFVPVRSIPGFPDSQQLMENAELETEYM